MDDLGLSQAAPAMQSGLCHKPEPCPPDSVLRHEPIHRLFKSVEQAFRHQALQQMRAEGIDDLFPGAVPLVLHLGDQDGVTVSELGKRCGLESSTMSPLLDELERRQIASRHRDPDDRRVVRLYLTEHGASLEPRLRRLVLRLQETAFAGIPEDDLGTMRRVLERVLGNLGAAGGPP